MSQRTTEYRPLSEVPIVDTDVHLPSTRAEEIRPYLEEPHYSRMRTSGEFPPLPLSGWDRFLGGKIEGNPIRSPEDIREGLVDRFHVDYPIINATSFLPKLPETDLAIALMSAYNDQLLDEYLDDNDDFYGLATIATQKPAEAAAEIERLGDEDSIVGAYVATAGPNPPLGDPVYDPMYRAAEDNDMPIAFHGSSGGFPFEFPRQNQAFEKYLTVHALAHPWPQMMTFTSLLVHGVPEKFPDLDFLFLEAGVGWVPYMTFRLNKEYSMRRSEAPLLEQSPEEYVRESFYFASQPVGESNDPQHMRQLMDVVGADSLMFSSDFPHWDFDNVDSVDRYLKSFFSPEEREQVLNGNALEVFDIP
ncbi:MAG: amidohydrolase family protein [Haloferacaceae archaeon]